MIWLRPDGNTDEPDDTPKIKLPGGSIQFDITPGMTAQGLTCMLACGGPSLTEQLSLLERHPDIHVMAINNAATVVRPHYWVTMDHPGRFHPRIWTDDTIRKFVNSEQMHRPIRVRTQVGEWMPSSFTPSSVRRVLGYRLSELWLPDRWLTMSEIYAGPRGSRSTILAALRIAYDIGFRFVGLLGCDWHMDQSQPYAFNQGKGRSQVEESNRLFASTEQILMELEPRFRDAGFTVLNLTDGSKLRAFERVPLQRSLEHFERLKQHCGASLDETGGLYHGV